MVFSLRLEALQMLNEGLGKPDTKTLTLTADMEYLVLASDGLWYQVTKTKTSHAAFDETNSFGLMILM